MIQIRRLENYINKKTNNSWIIFLQTIWAGQLVYKYSTVSFSNVHHLFESWDFEKKASNTRKLYNSLEKKGKHFKSNQTFSELIFIYCNIYM